MKKRSSGIVLLVSTVLVFGLFLFIKFSGEDEKVLFYFRNEPPTPTITADGKSIPVIRGSYCWDGPLSS